MFLREDRNCHVTAHLAPVKIGTVSAQALTVKRWQAMTRRVD